MARSPAVCMLYAALIGFLSAVCTKQMFHMLSRSPQPRVEPTFWLSKARAVPDEGSRDDDGIERQISDAMLLAGVDAPLLSDMKSAFSGMSLSAPVSVVQETFATDMLTCDSHAMFTEGWTMRRPSEKRLIFASCGGVGTTYVLSSLRDALSKYGYTTNCHDIDLLGFKHAYPFVPNLPPNPTRAQLPGLQALHCVEPDRIIYLFSDLHAQTRSLYRRGFSTCMGEHYMWDPSLYTAIHIREYLDYSKMTEYVGRVKFDVLGRNQHMMGWMTAAVPAPTLFIYLDTLFAETHILEKFLGVPSGVLSHLKMSERTSPTTHVLNDQVYQEFYTNMNRQLKTFDKHLVVPRGFVDRIRAVSGPVERSPYDTLPLACPALQNIDRRQLTTQFAPLLPGPSLAHAPLDRVLGQCGAAYRSKLMKYVTLHNSAIQRMRSFVPNSKDSHQAVALPKVVVWRCKSDDPRIGCGGLADRLVGIESVFAFALRYGRVFLLDLPGISDVLPAPLFNYDFDSALVAGRATRTYDLVNCETILNHQPCLWGREHPDLDFPDDVVVLYTNRGAYGSSQRFPQLAALDLSPSVAPLCLLHSIFSPVPSLVADAHALRQMLGGPLVSLIGVHFRLGDVNLVGSGPADAAAVRRDIYLAQYTSCISNFTTMLQANGLKPKLLIIGDDEEMRRRMWQRYTDMTVPLNSTPAHVEPAIYTKANKALPGDAAAVLRSAVFEWLLYAQADVHLRSAHSGFSRTAWAFSGRPFSVQVVEDYGHSTSKSTCIIQSLPQAAIHISAAGI